MCVQLCVYAIPKSCLNAFEISIPTSCVLLNFLVIMLFGDLSLISLPVQVEVVHYIIDICTHLKDLRDFMSLKILLSAVRTTVGQTQLTQLTWNVSDCMY